LTKGLQHTLALEYQPQAQRIVELINLAISRVRSLAHGLSPIHVDAKSLEAVLRQTVSEASELLGVACELELDQYEDTAQPDAIAQLCLIAREALTNAVRHGHAQNIVVKLSRSGDQSTLSVADDGVGIGELDKPLEGLGLRSMRYRAQMIGGKLDILHTRRGTTVRCCWRDP
jgi:signal transduction histidine kinase